MTLELQWVYRTISKKIEEKYDKPTLITLLLLEPDIIKKLFLEHISSDSDITDIINGYFDYILENVTFTPQEITEFVDKLAEKIWFISQNGRITNGN